MKRIKIIAIMGSPRKGGNTDSLLDEFLRGVHDKGGESEKICIGDLNISPCQELLECEKTGKCPLEDDMESVREKLLQADKIVVASPIFFYGLPSQLKALIDRGNVFWARKHLLNIQPKKSPKEAYALLLGATKGEKLFGGALLTLKYFLESLDTHLAGSLLFRRIEKKGDIRKHPTALSDAYQAGHAFAQE